MVRAKTPTELIALVALILVILAGCTTGAPTAPCPDPDPNPISPCATSHSQTHGMP